MGLNEDYAYALLGLLPNGPAWPRDADSPHAKLMGGLAQEFWRVDDQADTLSDEADPRTANVFLSRWEAVAGIKVPATTLVQRQLSLTTYLTRRGGQTPAYFIAMAAAMGFIATITEYHEHSFDDDFDQLWNGVDWAFTWQLNVPFSAGNVIDLTVDGDVNTPFGIYSDSFDTRPFVEYKPGYTSLIFSYN